MPRLPSRFAEGSTAEFARAALVVVAAVALGAGTLGCPPAATLPAGCSKDVDCKGARICVVHACVDPPPKPSAADLGALHGDGGASGDGGGTDLLAAVGDGGVSTPPAPPLGASPTFHGDAQHTGRSRFRAPANAPSEVAHVATGGVVFGSPALTDDGVAIFGSHDKSIYAVDPSGKILWRHATNDLVWSSPTIGPGGVVYIGSDDDHVYALDLKDGSVRWTFQAGPCRVNTGVGPEGARCDVDGVSVASDGTIYAAADGLYALTPDGKLKWKFAPGVTHCAAPPAIGLDGTVYIGCHDDALYAIAPDGKKKWDFRAGDDIDSAPVVGPDGLVYVGSDDHKLYALAPGGSVRWAVTTGGPVRSSPALAADGTVYVGSFDGSLYAVKAGGVVAWSFRSADRIASSPLVDAAGNVLIGSEDDRLYALAPDGKLVWSVLLDGDVDSTPALAADGTIWVGCDDRALHALR